MLFLNLYAVIPAIAIIWIIYQAVFSDHIWYNPNDDYLYDIKSNSEKISIKNSKMTIDTPSKQSTSIIEIEVRATFLGYIFDPCVVITSGGKQISQFFERGVNGKRFLNISNLCCGKKSITIELNTIYCSVNNSCILHSYDNLSINKDTVMVIAPHADDAEIAAFGLYSCTKSHIVTLTAGEVEPETFKHFSTHSEKASRLKGLVRSWDSLAIPVWGNQPFTHSTQLGYFCKQLARMKEDPNHPVQSLKSSIDDTRTFRVFNTTTLTSDQSGKATWCNLVQDLVELIDLIKPTSIVTPHEQIDSHPDHIFATKALKEALSKTKNQPSHLLLYANHLTTTDMHPFGPAHTIASLPPSFEMTEVDGLYSVSLDEDQQVAKAIALEMMHDLRRPIKFKKKIRTLIQHFFIRRKLTPYGDDPFFRKSVRCNELFFIESIHNDA